MALRFDLVKLLSHETNCLKNAPVLATVALGDSRRSAPSVDRLPMLRTAKAAVFFKIGSLWAQAAAGVSVRSRPDMKAWAAV